MRHFDQTTHDNAAFLLITFLLHNNANLSPRSMAALWQALGINVSHTTLEKRLAARSKNDFIDMYPAEISTQNIPQALKKTPALSHPRTVKRNSVAFLNSACVPRKFLINVLPRLEPGDLPELERRLRDREGNSKNSYKCVLDILDVIIKCVVYREYARDKSNIWEIARHINFCRLYDEGWYALDNSAFRTNIENCSVGQLKRNHEPSPAVDEHNSHIKEQIRLQLEIRRIYLSDVFRVESVEDRLITIAEYQCEKDEETCPGIHGNEEYVLETLKADYGMQNQRVWCRMRNGTTCELFYVKNLSGGFKDFWLMPPSIFQS